MNLEDSILADFFKLKDANHCVRDSIAASFCMDQGIENGNSSDVILGYAPRLRNKDIVYDEGSIHDFKSDDVAAVMLREAYMDILSGYSRKFVGKAKNAGQLKAIVFADILYRKIGQANVLCIETDIDAYVKRMIAAYNPKPQKRIANARKMDNLIGLKERYASNKIHAKINEPGTDMDIDSLIPSIQYVSISDQKVSYKRIIALCLAPFVLAGSIYLYSSAKESYNNHKLARQARESSYTVRFNEIRNAFEKKLFYKADELSEKLQKELRKEWGLGKLSAMIREFDDNFIDKKLDEIRSEERWRKINKIIYSPFRVARSVSSNIYYNHKNAVAIAGFFAGIYFLIKLFKS